MSQQRPVVTSGRPEPAPKPAGPKSATADPKRPYHVGVAVGVTTGAYALSLLAVSTIQIQHDRALILDRRPVAEAIVVLGDHHDTMEQRLELARSRYAAGADGYGALITRLDVMRDRLAKLGESVAGIERASGALAAGVPGVPGSARYPGPASPGRSSGGGSTSSGAGAPRSVPAAPPPVAAPPVSGSTGASGAP